ncbi:BTB/POZ domain-containing protein At3g19850-like [Lycium ferocissimum]|uniref:BTB/POZ domain-containing protein At3g19850-like n=1 Tax=Lycium ferocissimum TaxID=112874 RepID=UPI0028168EEC|nr:BTB/POZ domain-containing protein At3g19850-like [Lycium ferocissimum]
MPDLCDLQIHVNGQQTFFLHEKVFSRFCGKLRKIIKEEKRRSQIRKSGIVIDDFPGGAEGFELVSRFCYNNGIITITASNVSLLHCCAVSLGMTEKVSSCNLLHQSETYLEGLFNWSRQDILTSLKACESFFSFADSCGLIQKLINSLLAKISQNSDVFASSSSSSSSPDTRTRTPSSSFSSANKSAWWFEDMTILSPSTIEQFLKTLGAFGSDNNNLVLTRFVLHYLKTSAHNNNLIISRSEYTGLADTAVHGVVLMGKTSFSCRSLFWVLRIVSGFGLSRECRAGLEKLIGGLLDQATLDDLLICGHNGGAYDVNIVLRLIRLFVHRDSKILCVPRMMKVGRLIDKYLREIAPDQSLKISKFLGVAESLPDYARESFDGVYRAIDIYLESHPALPLEERSRLCRCLNYDKLSLEACKDLAKNPRIPPRIAVQALASQGSSLPTANFVKEKDAKKKTSISNKPHQMVLYKKNKSRDSASASDHHDQSLDEEDAESEHMRLNLQRMQWKVVELEKVCREMKGQMSRMVKTGAMVPPPHTRSLPRLC